VCLNKARKDRKGLEEDFLRSKEKIYEYENENKNLEALYTGGNIDQLWRRLDRRTRRIKSQGSGGVVSLAVHKKTASKLGGISCMFVYFLLLCVFVQVVEYMI